MDSIAAAVVVIAALLSGSCLGSSDGVSVGYLFDGETCGCFDAFVHHVCF